MKPSRQYSALALAAAVVAARVQSTYAQNTLYKDLAANQSSIVYSSSTSTYNVNQNGTVYLTVTKPSPPNLLSSGGNESWPWISTNGGYTSNDAFGYQILPSPEGTAGFLSSTDKTDTRVSYGDDTSALSFDSVKYLGFALNLPAADFTAPNTVPGTQIVQWWQGSPYDPPLALELTGESGGMATWGLEVHDNQTGGNPSSPHDYIGTGTIPFDSWNTFVVETYMDYANDDAHIELWENNTLLVNWTGDSVAGDEAGYNPATIPYNPPTGQSNPNKTFDVFIGPYRPAQETEQEELFDDIRWANDYNDAVPVPQAEVVLSSTSALTVPTDGDIGGSLSSGLSFSGGTLTVTKSFTSGRAVTIASQGGTLDVNSGVTFGFGKSLTWTGGTLNLNGPGTATIAQTSGTVSVSTGSALDIASNAHAIVSGSIDPFTDSSVSANHVAILDSGALTISVNSTIAGITGLGALTIGSSTSHNTLHLAPSGGTSTVSSLAINPGSALDISNNEFLIEFAGASDPIQSIDTYLANNQIISSALPTSGSLIYGVGSADGKNGMVAGLASGQIELLPTLGGDARLAGTVTFADFQLVLSNFGLSGLGWDEGNFLYSSTVDFADFQLVLSNFGASAAALTGNQDASLNAFAAQFGDQVTQSAKGGLSLISVPEPVSLAFIPPVLWIGFIRRRRVNKF